jgi:hypothetical protein
MIIVIKLIYNKTYISVLFEILQETENHSNGKNSHYQRSVRSKQCTPSCCVVHGNIHSVQMKVEPSLLRTYKPLYIPHTNNLCYT